MNKRFFVFVALILVMVIASCSPNSGSNQSGAGAAPAECASDAFGCAKIAPGQTIKIGMGAPMTGGDASFGIDISQGGRIAVTDAGELEGFKFELIAEDDGGTAEGGAAVANKLVADPTRIMEAYLASTQAR